MARTGKTERSEKAEVGAKQRAYLRDTLKELGIKPSAMARAIELAPSTFTRFMKEPDSSEKTLSARTMSKVEQLRQANSDSIVPTSAQAAWQSFHEEAVQFIAEGVADADFLKALQALIADRPGIDPWTLRTRSLELEGFMPGDIVLVDLNASPRPGDAVCAQVYDRGHTKAETVMRVFQNAGPVNLLVTRTMDPHPAKPLVVDNDRVLIRGVLLPHRLRMKIAA